MRKVQVKRKTAETDIEMFLNLDSFKPAKIQTDIPFLNHINIWKKLTFMEM